MKQNLKIADSVIEQGNRWKRGMLPQNLLSIKGRSCNQTLLVHQDMDKENHLLWK